MSLPASFQRDGFVAKSLKRIRRRIMVGTEGDSESGKTEFYSSFPGPGVALCLDRGHEAMLDNPNPPSTRRNDFIYIPLTIPVRKSSKDTISDYGEAWREFKQIFYKALDNPDCLTVAIDTDTVSYELQLLTDFGKLNMIPPDKRAETKLARRAMITRAYDSGKNIVATNMLKDEYEDTIDENGNKVMKGSRVEQHRTGNRVRQGFPDQDYLYQIQLRHITRPPTTAIEGGKLIKLPNGKEIQAGGKIVKVPTQYGIRIMKCKANTEMVGVELWGKLCNFQGLVQTVYPHVPMSEWGV